jgi:hypothetical protein
MDWPPKVGELLPRAEDATGVRSKLAGYSLNANHPDGGPKARGFSQILGITAQAIDYLEVEIHMGILASPIRSIRDNGSRGINCVVEFPLRGLGQYRGRAVALRTIWQYADADESPRLVTAFLRP